MGTSVYEKTNSLGQVEKHVIKEYQLPFIKIYRETIFDEQNKKQTVKKEIRLMDDKREIKNSAVISLVSAFSFGMVCKGVGKIISACKGTTK